MILITPTGGRPECGRLLKRWLARQTYRGPRYWIVLDDCDPPMPDLGADRVMRPSWRWRPGANTHQKNLIALLDAASDIHDDKLLIIEDDEWYGPDYLRTMSERLDEQALVGQGRAIYYNVARRTYRVLPNERHVCLCRTGIRLDGTRLLEQLRQTILTWTEGPFFDQGFWETQTPAGIFFGPPLSIGIKGMPGRNGLGKDHGGHKKAKPDHDLSRLKEWLGQDARFYAGYYQGKPS